MGRRLIVIGVAGVLVVASPAEGQDWRAERCAATELRLRSLIVETERGETLRWHEDRARTVLGELNRTLARINDGQLRDSSTLAEIGLRIYNDHIRFLDRDRQLLAYLQVSGEAFMLAAKIAVERDIADTQREQRSWADNRDRLGIEINNLRDIRASLGCPGTSQPLDLPRTVPVNEEGFAILSADVLERYLAAARAKIAGETQTFWQRGRFASYWEFRSVEAKLGLLVEGLGPSDTANASARPPGQFGTAEVGAVNAQVAALREAWRATNPAGTQGSGYTGLIWRPSGSSPTGGGSNRVRPPRVGGETTLPPIQSSQANSLPAGTWEITESGGWSGTFSPRAGGLYDGRWTRGGSTVTEVLEISLAGNRVTARARESSNNSQCTYTGTLRGERMSGTYTCANFSGGPRRWEAVANSSMTGSERGRYYERGLAQAGQVLYAPNEPVTIEYSGLPGNAQDWVAVVAYGDSDNTHGTWEYTGGKRRGTMTIPQGLAPGEYEVRVFFDWPAGGYEVKSRSLFRVGAPDVIDGLPPVRAPLARAARSGYAPNQAITIEYSGLPGNPQDWVAVVSRGDPDNTHGTWEYTGGKRSGTMTIPQGLAEGEYEVRVYFDWPRGEYTVQSRSTFRVGTP